MLLSFIKYFLFLIYIIIFTNTANAATHHPQDFLTQIKNTPDENKQIVEHFCATCHAEEPLINLGAPRINHPNEWQTRIKQGLEVLFQHVNNGYNAMPARGGCFECTDAQLRLAISYIIHKN